MVTTRLTPSYATVIVLVSDAVLPSADVAVTLIVQRPAVRSRGGNEYVPSSATSTVAPGSGVGPGAAPDALGAGFGVGFGDGAPAAEPRKVAVSETVFAFVVVPSTAMAP